MQPVPPGRQAESSPLTCTTWYRWRSLLTDCSTLRTSLDYVTITMNAFMVEDESQSNKLGSIGGIGRVLLMGVGKRLPSTFILPLFLLPVLGFHN